MKSDNKIKMSFVCNQNWDNMKTTEHGRHCDVCRREIFDFTKKTKDEINKAGENACGIFLPEQVEDGLTPVNLNFISKTKYYIATAATVFGLEVHQLNAQSTNTHLPKVEIVAGDSVQRRTPMPEEATDSVKLKENTAVETPIVRSHQPFMRIGRMRFYTKDSFPFIKIRRRYLMGKF